MGSASPPGSPGSLGEKRVNREVCDEDSGDEKRSMVDLKEVTPKWREV